MKRMGSVLTKPDQLPGESLLLDVADVLATSLDLDTTVRRVAEVVRKVIDYEIFAILLLNEKTQELRFRFQVGYPPEFAERTRIKVGEGVTGQAAQLRQAILIDDVTRDPRYIAAVPNVRSELAVPLITKNRVIGVIDIEAREPGYFTEEHKRLLTLVASRMAAGIENAFDDGRIDVRDIAFENIGADHHRHAGEADIVLERDAPAGELAARCALD